MHPLECLAARSEISLICSWQVDMVLLADRLPKQFPGREVAVPAQRNPLPTPPGLLHPELAAPARFLPLPNPRHHADRRYRSTLPASRRKQLGPSRDRVWFLRSPRQSPAESPPTNSSASSSLR